MEQNKSSKMRFIVIGTLVAVAVIVAFVFLNSKEEAEPTKIEQIDVTGQPSMGEENAPVQIVEFGDFKCPSCKTWGDVIFPKLAADYIKSGDVQFSFVNVLFHGEESALASMAAESVFERTPDVYWDFHHALYGAQPVENHDAAWVTPEKVLEIASEFAEIDQALLKEDMEQQATLDNVKIDDELVTKTGVNMTPTVVINGKMMVDPFDYETIQEVIEQEIEDAK